MRRFLAGRGYSIMIHCVGLLPAAWLLEAWLSRSLGVDPLLSLEQFTGRTALGLLVLTLAVTPLARLLREPCLGRARLPLGLYTAAYALLHLLILVGLDYGFDLSLFLAAFAQKPLFWTGLGTLLILLALAVTSLPSLRIRLGAGWKRLHRLIYLAALLDLAHFFLAVKGNLITLSGAVQRPLLYSLAVAVLIGSRVLLARMGRANPR